MATTDGRVFGIPAEYQLTNLHEVITNNLNFVRKKDHLIKIANKENVDNSD